MNPHLKYDSSFHLRICNFFNSKGTTTKKFMDGQLNINYASQSVFKPKIDNMNANPMHLNAQYFHMLQ